MNADDLKKLEEELKNRESILQAREESLKRLDEEKGKTVLIPSPAPSSYAASIKTYVPITLDLQDSNYVKWRELFLVALGRYGLSNHVIGDAAATPSDTSPTSDWGRDDYTVLSWIYGSISLELFGIIMAPGSSARQIWDAIANLFHDNKKSRALALDAEFRNTPQGDMTISEYCAKLKNLSDALADAPFPSFLQTRSALVLEEAQKKTDAKNATATALWASGNSILPSAGGERAPSGGTARGSSVSFNSNGQGYRGGGGGGGGGRGRGRGGRGRGRSEPWMFNPWTGLPTRAGHAQHPAPSQPQPWQQPRAWRAPAPGLLGPRPTSTSQAYAAYAPAAGYTNTQLHQAAPPLNFQQQQQQLDPALVTALNNMHFPNNEWYMDSGASSHMASDPGSSIQDRDSSMQ